MQFVGLGVVGQTGAVGQAVGQLGAIDGVRDGLLEGLSLRSVPDVGCSVSGKMSVAGANDTSGTTGALVGGT